MKSRIIWCLVGINIALVAMFIVPRIKPNSALAQRADRPADYLLIPGNIIGVDRGVVYVIDSSNGQMSALAYDETSGRLAVMQPTDLQRVFTEGQDAVNGQRRRR